MKRGGISAFLIFTLLFTLVNYAPFSHTKSKDIIIISPSKDSYVSQLKPDSNYGNEYKLIVRSYKEGNIRTLLEFDVTGLSQLDIINITLRLYCFHEPPPTRTYLIRRTTDSWNEMKVTWNNQPSVSTEFVASIPPNGTRWWSVDIVSLLDPDKNSIGFRIEDSEENHGASKTSYFYSKENRMVKNAELKIFYEYEDSAERITEDKSLPLTYILTAAILFLMGIIIATRIHAR